jgi:hypothetical protein
MKRILISILGTSILFIGLIFLVVNRNMHSYNANGEIIYKDSDMTIKLTDIDNMRHLLSEKQHLAASECKNMLDTILPSLKFISKYEPYDSLFLYMQFKLIFEDAFTKSYGKMNPDILRASAKQYDGEWHISNDSAVIFSENQFMYDYRLYLSALEKIIDKFMALSKKYKTIISLNISKGGMPLWEIYSATGKEQLDISNSFFEIYTVRFGHCGIPKNVIDSLYSDDIIFIQYYSNIMHIAFPFMENDTTVCQVILTIGN